MWNIQTFSELPSTQSLARERFYLGSGKHGDVFVALHQTGGKGRYETRVWHDEPGANLLMSLILTEIPQHLQHNMQFLIALSTLSAIRNMVKEEKVDSPVNQIRLKWSNDILIGYKKVSGILTEGIWSGDSLKGMIVGIGININQNSFSDEISARAIALKEILGYEMPLERIRDQVLTSLQRNLSYYSASLLLMNDVASELEWLREIEHFSLVNSNGTKAEGLRYDGITGDGALKVFTSDGSIQTFQNATLIFS
jgi:BirA family transcriptional regulator, biotin operon repressor / biotin---[acetyl-CoA-carboxylase] ligase